MKVTQEPDQVDHKIILWVMIATVGVTLLGVLIAWGLLEWKLARLGSSDETLSARTRKVPAEVNAMEQTLFDQTVVPRRGRDMPERLEQYGFVDRDAGLVHVPIRRAMELYLKQQQAGPSRPAPKPPATSATEPTPQPGQESAPALAQPLPQLPPEKHRPPPGRGTKEVNP